ncbi:B3 domain-containing protein [Drosera capensis]
MRHADEDKHRVLSVTDSPESEERLQSPDKQEEIVATEMETKKDDSKEKDGTTLSEDDLPLSQILLHKDSTNCMGTPQKPNKQGSKKGKRKLIGPVKIENGADTPPVSKNLGKKKVTELAEIEHGSGAPSVSKEVSPGCRSSENSRGVKNPPPSYGHRECTEVAEAVIARPLDMQSKLDQKFPSFVKVLARSLGLPVAFSKKHLPKKDVQTAAGGESKKRSLSPTVSLRRKKFKASPPEEDLLQLKDDENMDSSSCTTPQAPNDQVIKKVYCRRDQKYSRAQDVQSKLDHKYPSSLKLLAQSHIGHRYRMWLPTSFCETYLPKKNSAVLLENESGKKNQAVYEYKYKVYIIRTNDLKKRISGASASSDAPRRSSRSITLDVTIKSKGDPVLPLPSKAFEDDPAPAILMKLLS